MASRITRVGNRASLVANTCTASNPALRPPPTMVIALEHHHVAPQL